MKHHGSLFYQSAYNFFIWLAADLSISFLVPTVSKATSTSASPPMGRTEPLFHIL